MKFAFLILAHEDPAQLRRLIHALDDPHFDIYVHIAAHAELSDYGFDAYQLRHSRLTVLDEQIRTYWGDISLVDVMLALYRRAFENGPYDRYITLSGLDYPLKSNREILNTLADTNREFISARPLLGDLDFKIRGIYLWKHHLLARIARHLVCNYRVVMHPSRLKLRKGDWHKSQVYFSSQWHALSGESVEYLLKTLDENPRIRQFFRWAYAPDELLIPTVLCNSPFAQRMIPGNFPEGQDFEELFVTIPAIHCLRREKKNVIVFREADYDLLMDSGKLFCRKVRTGISDSLLDRVDQHRNKLKGGSPYGN